MTADSELADPRPKPKGQQMHQSVVRDTAEDSAERLRFAKALGEELRARGAHDFAPGSLGHELALEAAGRAAEARCRK